MRDLLAPLAREEIKIVRCLGLNYADHAVSFSFPPSRFVDYLPTGMQRRQKRIWLNLRMSLPFPCLRRNRKSSYNPHTHPQSPRPLLQTRINPHRPPGKRRHPQSRSARIRTPPRLRSRAYHRHWQTGQERVRGGSAGLCAGVHGG